MPASPVATSPAPATAAAVDHGGPRPLADKQRAPVSIRLSERERADVAAAAAAEGRPPSTFVRLAALAAAGRPPSPLRAERDALARETARAVGQLGRVGSLANQIAAAANSGGLPSTDTRFALDRLARELAQLRSEFVGRAGERRRG